MFNTGRIMPLWSLVLGGIPICVIPIAVYILIPNPYVPFISFVLTYISVVVTVIIAGRGKIEVAHGAHRVEKLAAKVYRSEQAVGANIYSLIDAFRSPKTYTQAFSESKAKKITILGAADPNTMSFLGAIYRLRLAKTLHGTGNAEIEIFQVDHSKMRAKFILSELNGVPQYVVLCGKPGKKSEYGIELCKTNPMAFDIFKPTIDALFKDPLTKPMEDHVTRVLSEKYQNMDHSVNSILEFVENVVVPVEVSYEFKKKYGKVILDEVTAYVKEIVTNNTSNGGAKCSKI